MHKIGNIVIMADVVSRWICCFLLNLYHMMFANVKLDISGCNRITL